MVRTIASQDEFAVLQSNSGLEDKQEPTDKVISKQTERKLVFYNREINGLFRAANNWVYEALKVNPEKNVNKTIKAAKQAVAALAKENVMLKEQLDIYKES